MLRHLLLNIKKTDKAILCIDWEEKLVQFDRREHPWVEITVSSLVVIIIWLFIKPEYKTLHTTTNPTYNYEE